MSMFVLLLFFKTKTAVISQPKSVLLVVKMVN